MKYIIHLLLTITFAAIMNCCNSSTKSTDSISAYEKAYAKQFNQLISQCKSPHELADTLYVEMYIALKAMKEDSICGDIVIERVNELLKIDTVAENRRKYIEAASIVYSLRKDSVNFWKMRVMDFNSYPEKSLERLGSFAAYYSTININTDSASHYIQASNTAANGLLSSKNANDRIEGALGMAFLYVLQGDDEMAIESLNYYINHESNAENVEMVQDVIANFDEFKSTILLSRVQKTTSL